MLRNYTIVLAVATFVLLIAGGLVTSTGSGLAVPDWPLSYGKLMPPMVGGIFYEHGHRMIATFVGILTVILVILVYRREKRTWVRRLSVAALGAVIVQGLLGGLTVILLLPTLVSAGHATLAQTFFCIVLTLAFVQTDWWKTNGGKGVVQFSRVALVLPVVAVFIQLILGALMRHSQAGVIVPDFPLAYGGLIPSLSDESLKAYTDILVRKDLWLWANGQVTAWQISIHLLHRYWGLFLGVYLLWFAVRTLRSPSTDPQIRVFAISLAMLVLAQVALGILTVLLGRPVGMATAHQSVGALVLGATYLTVLHLWRLGNTYTLVELLPVKRLLTTTYSS